MDVKYLRFICISCVLFISGVEDLLVYRLFSRQFFTWL